MAKSQYKQRCNYLAMFSENATSCEQVVFHLTLDLLQ